MAWNACSPWQKEFNTHQKSTLFHENGRFFLSAHLSSYFSNPVAYASEQLFSSTGTATDQILTCPLVEPSWGQHRFLWLTPTHPDCSFQVFAPSVAQMESHTGTSIWLLQVKGTVLDETRFTCLLLHPGFSPDVGCLEHSHIHLRKLANTLISVSCCNEFLVSPVLFPHPVTSLSLTHFATLRVFFGTHEPLLQ